MFDLPSLNSHALQVVNAAVTRSDEPLLDRELLHYQPGGFRDFIDALLLPAKRPRWMDVPVAAVVGLHHVNFVESDVRATLRSCTRMLSATHWDDRVFTYWEGEIRDSDFPPSDSRRALRLECLAGAVVTDNGVHRLVAGAAWLIATQGRDARLRRVRTEVRLPRDPAFFQEVVDLCARHKQAEVVREDLSRTAPSCFLLKLTPIVGQMSIVVVDLEQRTIKQHRMPRTHGSEPDRNWAPIPAPIVVAWSERAWLEGALASAERCPTRID